MNAVSSLGCLVADPRSFIGIEGCVLHTAPLGPLLVLQHNSQVLPATAFMPTNLDFHFHQVLSLGYISLINMHLDTTGLGGTAMHRHLFIFTWHWSPMQVKRATCPKKVAITAEPASNNYEIYFRCPAVFKWWGGNILKMQTCLPTWGDTATRISW